jgi:hypothetical protein
MATKNRRRFLRTKAQNLVAHFRMGDRGVLAPIEDISMGGALLKTSETIQMGTVLAFDVARPGLKKPLRLMGRVVDVRPSRGVGLKFDGLDRDAHERLIDLLRDLGAVVSTPLTDVPDAQLHIPPPRTSSSVMSIPPGSLPPSTGSYSVSIPPTTGAHSVSMPPTPSAAQPEDAQRLMVQLRGAIMEIGNLQQQLVTRDREMLALKDQVTRLAGEAKSGGAAETLVGKMEMEKQRLEAELQQTRARARADVDAVKREADSVLQSMARLVDALKRLG